MGQSDVILPLMGEGITDATITKYLVKEGDDVFVDTLLVEVETDKVDSKILSPFSGKVVKITQKEGDIIPVGTILLIVDSQDSTNTSAQEPSEKSERVNFTTFAIPKENIENENENKINNTKQLLSPLVKQLVREYSIANEEINQITGSGLGGKITKEDILTFLNKRVKSESSQEKKSDTIDVKITSDDFEKHPGASYSSENVEIVEMDRMRKIIAEHMVYSVQTSPHATSFIEVDVTRLVEWRNKVKDEFLKKHGEKLTFMPVFIESTAMAINDFPLVNISLEESKILIKKNINIGIATSLSSGDLIVPVIINADQKNLIGLAKSLNDLATRTKSSMLLPDEIKGGTFTITNLGSFGTLAGTSIINQPEVAILAIGEIRKIPAVVETSSGDAIAIRHKVIISLTFDHRIIDGAFAGSFLKKVKELLQNFDVLRKF